MNWQDAIRLFVGYKVSVLTDGKRTAVEKAEDRARNVRYLLSQMPNLADKNVEEITPQIWWDSIQAYKRSNRDFKGGRANWNDLLKWSKYEDLRACLVFAKDGYECHYCYAKHPDDDVILTVDHLVPRSRDGGDYLDNLVCCCDMCNRAKLNDPKRFQKWIKLEGLSTKIRRLQQTLCPECEKKFKEIFDEAKKHERI